MDAYIANERIKLSRAIKQILIQLSQCEDAMREFTKLDKKWDVVVEAVESLNKELDLITPVKCPCGSIEFEKKEIAVLSIFRQPIDRPTDYGRIKPYVNEIKYKYFCTKCGTEI